MVLKKRISSFLLMFLFAIGAAVAQPDPIKWGKVEDELVAMEVYPLDSGAAAVVLADYGVAYFTFSSERGFRLNLDRHVRIKILNSSGLEYANQQIPLYHKGMSKEEVSGLKGYTYNMEGKQAGRTKMKNDQEFKEVYNENLDFVKFTLPNVKVGAVIEFKYTLQSDFIYNLFTWEFQRDIPVKWSEFRAKIPEYFYYKNIMSGYLPITLAESEPYTDSFRYSYREMAEFGQRMKETTRGTVEPRGTYFRWVVENAPAIREEAYITTIRDYVSKMEFELSYTNFPGQTMEYFSNSWEKLAQEFMEHPRFGGQLKNTKFVRDLVTEVCSGASADMEKVSRIVNYLKMNIHYNGKDRVYAEQDLKKVLKEKAGSAAEINLLMAIMLNEAGIKADPVILSTRSNGRVNKIIPLEQDFNYVVVQTQLNGGALLLDATDPHLPLSMLPYKCLSQEGRLISASGGGWVSLQGQGKVSEASQAVLQLNTDGSLTGQFNLKYGGYAAVNRRTERMADGDSANVAANFAKKGWKVNDYQLADSEGGIELKESVQVNIPAAATVAGDRIYFKPLLVGAEDENPFKLEKRTFPVDFGCPIESLSMVKLALPAGYEVEEMPKPLVLSMPDQSGVIRFTISQIGNELIIVNTLKIEKPLYLPEEYPALKKFFEIIVAKHAEQVVLKKTSN